MGGTLQINLVWQAGARLSLEVREPQGQSLHWRNPQTANGGSFTGSSESARLRGVFPAHANADRDLERGGQRQL